MVLKPWRIQSLLDSCRRHIFSVETKAALVLHGIADVSPNELLNKKNEMAESNNWKHSAPMKISILRFEIAFRLMGNWSFSWFAYKWLFLL